MPATDLLVGSAALVTSASGTLSNLQIGSSVFTPRGFQVRITAAGLTASKATSFGGTQLALAFPLAKNDARELAEAILELAD